LLFSLVIAGIIGLLMRGGSVGQSAIGVVLLLGFYVFWFIALLWGYISGFKVGWRFGGGLSLLECLRFDHLSRLILGCLNLVRRRKKGDHAP
jgi:hypothetical protein